MQLSSLVRDQRKELASDSERATTLSEVQASVGHAFGRLVRHLGPGSFVEAFGNAVLGYRLPVNIIADPARADRTADALRVGADGALMLRLHEATVLAVSQERWLDVELHTANMLTIVERQPALAVWGIKARHHGALALEADSRFSEAIDQFKIIEMDPAADARDRDLARHMRAMSLIRSVELSTSFGSNEMKACSEAQSVLLSPGEILRGTRSNGLGLLHLAEVLEKHSERRWCDLILDRANAVLGGLDPSVLSDVTGTKAAKYFPYLSRRKGFPGRFLPVMAAVLLVVTSVFCHAPDLNLALERVGNGAHIQSVVEPSNPEPVQLALALFLERIGNG